MCVMQNKEKEKEAGLKITPEMSDAIFQRLTQRQQKVRWHT